MTGDPCGNQRGDSNRRGNYRGTWTGNWNGQQVAWRQCWGSPRLGSLNDGINDGICRDFFPFKECQSPCHFLAVTLTMNTLIRILPCRGIESWIATQILGLMKSLVCGETLLIFGFCSFSDIVTMINRESDINRGLKQDFVGTHLRLQGDALKVLLEKTVTIDDGIPGSQTGIPWTMVFPGSTVYRIPRAYPLFWRWMPTIPIYSF